MSDDSSATNPSPTNSYCPNCSGEISLTENSFVCEQCGDQSSIGVETELRETTGKRPIPFELARFQILNNIGRGSFGVVYKAIDLELNRAVAIKTAIQNQSSQSISLFLREARATSRLHHPNIVTIFDFVKLEDRVFIVSELIDGITLREYLHETDQDLEGRLRLIAQICEAIQYAHDNNVIHRDLKPGNIMVDGNGAPHILDFGLSQSIDHAFETISREGVPLGTPAYMSPEQVKGSRQDLDMRTDTYSIGIILYQALTNNLPFVGQKKDVYLKILNMDPPSPKKFNGQISEALCKITLKAISKNPEDRYQNAGELAADINRYIAGDIVLAHPSIDARVIKTRFKKYWAYAAIGMLAVLAVFLFLFRPQVPPDVDPLTPVVITTSPPGATLTFIPLDQVTGFNLENETKQVTAGTAIDLSPGFYRVIARFEATQTVEVFRTVPERDQKEFNMNIQFFGSPIEINHRSWSVSDGVFELPQIEYHPFPFSDQRFTMMEGGDCSVLEDSLVLPVVSFKNHKLPTTAIAIREVTWADILEVWPDVKPPVAADEFAGGVPWDIAVTFAEAKGMSLPSVWELQFAATNRGTTEYPKDDETPDAKIQPPELEDWDQSRHRIPVKGLLTGMNEWTETPFEHLYVEDDRLVAPPSDDNGPNRFPSSCLTIGNRIFAESPVQVPFRLRAMKTLSVNPDPYLGFRLIRRLH